MGSKTAQDVLNQKGGAGDPIKRFVGQIITIVDYTDAAGTHGDYVLIDAVTTDGEEKTISTGAKAVVSKLKQLEKLDAFPIDVRVTTYPSPKGNDGFDLENV